MSVPGATPRWAFPPPADVSGLPSDMPAPVARILAARGIDTTGKLSLFLSPPHLPYDPRRLPGMAAAVQRLRHAVNDAETVGVFGDFDVDGITGTAIMCEGLESLGAHPIPYLPQRGGEGHGLSRGAIDFLIDSGATLIVTVDCGITDAPEVAYAASRGAEAIITDHHLPPDALPNAVSCVNAKLHGSEYPFSELCGAALAFKVIHGLHQSWGVPFDPALLELAALGSIADLVPLVDENRYLVQEGLKRLKQTRRPGLLALCEVARLSPEDIDSEKISFQIAPRLNAAGRMGDAADSFRLLTTRSHDEAEELAEKLEQMNRQRRQATDAAAALVIERVEAMPVLPSMLVVADESIPQGVAGLAASRLAETYRRPAAVLSVNGSRAVASARSIPEFNLVEAIADSSSLLVRYGGHAQAAGFTVSADRIDEVSQRLNAYAAEKLDSLDLSPELEIDAEIRLQELTADVYDWLRSLEPFGKGNRRPLFASLNVTALEARFMGNNQQHLRLRVEQDGREMTALAFNQAADWRAIVGPAGTPRLDLAFTLMLDSWHDKPTLALRVSKLRAAEEQERQI